MHKKIIFVIVLLPFIGCLMSGAQKERKKKDDQLVFLRAQKALDARDYADAIELFQLFTGNFPKSNGYTIALQRLGESFEGLLEQEYIQKVENGENEQIVRKEFISRYGHFNCWEKTSEGLKYNLIHYKTILAKFPDSPIADEAAYRIIPWESNYNGRPDGLLKEIKCLEEILQNYPSTSFRSEILYKIAHRFHILYEMYAFSTAPDIRNGEMASQYRRKAVYTYKLVLDYHDHTKYSQKAWRDLSMLEEGKRIYVFE